MNSQVIPLAVLKAEASKQRKREAPKGRRVDAGALEDVNRLRLFADRDQVAGNGERTTESRP